MPNLLKNIRFNQKMKPQNFTPTFRVNCLPFRVNSWTFRVKGVILCRNKNFSKKVKLHIIYENVALN